MVSHSIALPGGRRVKAIDPAIEDLSHCSAGLIFSLDNGYAFPSASYVSIVALTGGIGQARLSASVPASTPLVPASSSYTPVAVANLSATPTTQSTSSTRSLPTTRPATSTTPVNPSVNSGRTLVIVGASGPHWNCEPNHRVCAVRPKAGGDDPIDHVPTVVGCRLGCSLAQFDAISITGSFPQARTLSIRFA